MTFRKEKAEQLARQFGFGKPLALILEAALEEAYEAGQESESRTRLFGFFKHGGQPADERDVTSDLLALIRAAESAVITIQKEFEGTRYAGKADALNAALSTPSFAELRKAAGR